MGKYDVDFDDYEDKSGAGYDGEVPKKGNYPGKLVSLKEHTSGAGNEGLEWIFEITEGDYAGWRGWYYSDMENSKWKTQQIVKAINGGDEKKTSLDPSPTGKDGSDNKTVKKALPVRMRLTREMYDDGSGEKEPRAKIRAIMPDEDVSEKKASKKKKKKGDDPF